MRYTKHSLNQKSSQDIAKKRYEKYEGVFKTKFNKYVVRIKAGNVYKTIGQYETLEKANDVFSLANAEGT